MSNLEMAENWVHPKNDEGPTIRVFQHSAAQAPKFKSQGFSNMSSRDEYEIEISCEESTISDDNSSTQFNELLEHTISDDPPNPTNFMYAATHAKKAERKLKRKTLDNAKRRASSTPPIKQTHATFVSPLETNLQERPISTSHGSRLVLESRIPKHILMRDGETEPNIYGMSYNSKLDELFLADNSNHVVRTLHLRGNSGELRDIYTRNGNAQETSFYIFNVCYMNATDTLLVCMRESLDNWLITLCRNGKEWTEAQRLQTEETGWMCSSVDKSRVLIGGHNSTYLELLLVDSGHCITLVNRIYLKDRYKWFSAQTVGTALVALSCDDQSVRVNRLNGTQLDELARIKLNKPLQLLWLADRLLVTENNSKTVIWLEVGDSLTTHRCELIAESEIEIASWCAVDEGMVIFDYKPKTLLYFV